MFVVGACSTPGDTTPTHVFDPCSPLQLVTSTATDAQLAAIDEATASWAMPGVGRAATAPETLSVVFVTAAPAVYGEYADAIYINSDLASDQAATVIAHELGHAFGLVHVPAAQRKSVMNPGNLSVSPTADDHLAVEAIWGSCP